MPVIWAAGITAVGGIAAAAMTEAPEMEQSSAALDASGWNVAFPGARITSSRSEGLDPVDGEMRRYLLYFGVAAVVLVLVKRMRK